jgi:hypothetical protein
MVLRALLLLLAVCALSCASSSGGAASADAGTPGVTLMSQPYTVQPGQELFYCYTMTLPSDTVVTGFTPTYGKATHHILFAQTLSEEPNGFSDCPVLFKTTWAPLFVGGIGTSPLVLPEGVGMSLPKGTQILLQLHLLNASAETVTGTTGVTMQVAADPKAPFTPAGSYGLDDMNISIPPNSVGYQESMPCQVDKTMNVFAYFGHMHRIGTHLNLTDNGETLVDEGWNFDVQPTTSKTMLIKPNDMLKLTCSYTNTGTTPVVYGEDTSNEMCAFVFYYTNYTGLDGCVQQ